jgi:hypothetical protein
MKIHIDSIQSHDIRCEMQRDSYQYAELLGTYTHPVHTGKAWTVRLYHACDTLVIDTNGYAAWYNTEVFDELCEDYGIKPHEFALNSNE